MIIRMPEMLWEGRERKSEEGRQRESMALTILLPQSRSLVFVEGDASMSTYQDAEGKTRQSLNVIQRPYIPARLSLSTPAR